MIMLRKIIILPFLVEKIEDIVTGKQGRNVAHDGLGLAKPVVRSKIIN